MTFRCKIKEGPPGWFWAGLITTTILASWWLAVFGVGKSIDLWTVSGAQFLTYGGALVTAWLAYKGVKSRYENPTALPVPNQSPDVPSAGADIVLRSGGS